MRNPYEYPVTTDEIIETLTRLLEHEQKRTMIDNVIGDPTGMILQEAIERMRAAPSYRVTRIDDNGAQAHQPETVRDGLSKADAYRLFDLLTARGHHQTYHVVIDFKGWRSGTA